MHPIKLWWLMEAKKPITMHGDMTEDRVREIYEETYGRPSP